MDAVAVNDHSNGQQVILASTDANAGSDQTNQRGRGRGGRGGRRGGDPNNRSRGGRGGHNRPGQPRRTGQHDHAGEHDHTASGDAPPSHQGRSDPRPQHTDGRGAGRGRRGQRGNGNRRGTGGRGGPAVGRTDVKVDDGTTDVGDHSPTDPQTQTRTNAQPGEATKGPTRRTRGINSKLTTDADQTASSSSKQSHPRQRPKREALSGDDDNLTSRLIRSLSTAPYPDCPICFSAIHPAQPIWSCFPDENSDTQCCYTPFHFKCIKSWSTKSVHDVREAYRARGEDKEGDWRCPGCQKKRTNVPHSYTCFCAAVVDPRPQRLATPHSCGNPCSRRRSCGHACPLACHPGPCPQCRVTTQIACHCMKEIKSVKCADLQAEKRDEVMSCESVCGKPKDCGRHFCSSKCHPGECDKCEVVERVRCFCGREEKELKCIEGGVFSCPSTCDKFFDCGVHKCDQGCHPHEVGGPCPRSPALTTHCPCGKKSLLNRTSCTDDIPSCGDTCSKPLPGCEHFCPMVCHIGACKPCREQVTMPCRCGSTTVQVECGGKPEEVFCQHQCGGLMTCGRHRCTAVCCPLASFSSMKGKGKKRGIARLELSQEEHEWHRCEIVCGKTLGCGNHRCEERDHQGPCKPCLRSSFEEMICPCGRTVIEPPVPCGTRMSCTQPCPRPDPECGHPKVPHTCHEADEEEREHVGCPPCPFLTTKSCACGKKEVGNVRCSMERSKVSCGLVCGNLLDCGWHRCERTCHTQAEHGGGCGECKQVCRKARKLCLPATHPCTHLCHAPSACDESEPCQAIIVLTCSCGRMKKEARCSKCTSNPGGRGSGSSSSPIDGEGGEYMTLKCTSECAIAKRNAKLAEALGIHSHSSSSAGSSSTTLTNSGAAAERDRWTWKGKDVVYADEITKEARRDTKFVGMVETAFDEFILSNKQSHVLPHMPAARRRFVTELAAYYRMDTREVDPEPRRSVQVIKRIDTRIPKPLLSASIGLSAGGSGSGGAPSSLLGFGKLVTTPLLKTNPVIHPKPMATSIGGSGTAWKGWAAVAGNSSPARSLTPNVGMQTSTTPRTLSPAPAHAPAPLPRTASPALAVNVTNRSEAVGAGSVGGGGVEGDVPDDWEAE